VTHSGRALVAAAALLPLVSAAVVLGASGTHAARAAQSDERFEKLAQLITQKMAEHHIPGVAFGVSKDGRTLTRGFGVTNIAEPQPVTPETVFPVASISKVVAATAIMRLQEQGKLDLRAPVRSYVADFRVLDDATSRAVNLWHLLTHTPGWEGQLPTEDRGTQTLAYRTASLRELPQLAPAGAVWSYNNAGFGVAGRVIEVVTGKSIHEALRELVFQPLQLTRTFTVMGDVVTHRFAVGHRQRSTDVTDVVRPFELATPNVTAGGVAMSVTDLLRFGQFHIDGGTGEQSILSKPTIEQMRAAQVRKSPTEDDMGIGWHLRRLNDVVTAAHGGTDDGHVLFVEIVPERNLVLVVLTNHANGWRLIQDVERAALELYEGLRLRPNQSIAQRGVNESLAHATPLATQPELQAYIGTYLRPPLANVRVLQEDGRLMVASGNAAGTPLEFFGPDLAYGAITRLPYEFIRNADGTVGWIRVNGRIARKETH
jgi:CubicO group peptidase (beta-lactamase class C family)